MNIKWSKPFVVYPEDCNYMKVGNVPMVHGGAMLKYMDRSAAECVRRFLYDSPYVDASRTVGVDKICFLKPAKLGDLILVDCEVVRVTRKTIKVFVKCSIDNGNSSNIMMAHGEFTFCSFEGDNPHPHGLKLE